MTEYTNYPTKTDCYCRPCRAEYGREHYLKNKARYISNAKARTQRVLKSRMRYIVDYLHQHPCVDCGETDILVLEFDHLRDKRFHVTTGVRNHPWKAVLAELPLFEDLG